MANIEAHKDPQENAFLKTNLFYESRDQKLIQDPTVLGFKLLFDWENSPLLSPAPKITDGGDDQEGDSADLAIDKNNTAEGFLKSIGDGVRKSYLKEFKRQLASINQMVPWFFQTISGLDEAWARDFSEGPKQTEKSIEIECLESVDLKISSLIDLYRKACFDWPYKREIVPKNLREFNLKVFVLETRRFNWSFIKEDSENNSDLLEKHMRYNRQFFGYPDSIEKEANEKLAGSEDLGNMNRFMFDLNFCEFNIVESGAEMFSEISNAGGEAKTQKLVIDYEDMIEENIYRMLNGTSVVSDIIKGTLDMQALDINPQGSFNYGDKNIGDNLYNKDSLIDKIKSFSIEQKAREVQNELQNTYTGQNLRNQASARIQNELSGAASSLLLGNVYGISPSQIASLADDSVSGGVQAGLTLGAGSSVTNKSGTIEGENNYTGQSDSRANDTSEEDLGNNYSSNNS